MGRVEPLAGDRRDRDERPGEGGVRDHERVDADVARQVVPALGHVVVGRLGAARVVRVVHVARAERVVRGRRVEVDDADVALRQVHDLGHVHVGRRPALVRRVGAVAHEVGGRREGEVDAAVRDADGVHVLRARIVVRHDERALLEVKPRVVRRRAGVDRAGVVALHAAAGEGDEAEDEDGRSLVVEGTHCLLRGVDRTLTGAQDGRELRKDAEMTLAAGSFEEPWLQKSRLAKRRLCRQS